MAKMTMKSKRSAATKPRKVASQAKTKKETCIALLRRTKGASLTDLQKATGWQQHSVRGFLSGTVNKIVGVTLVSEQTKGGVRRYRIKAAKAP